MFICIHYKANVEVLSVLSTCYGQALWSLGQTCAAHLQDKHSILRLVDKRASQIEQESNLLTECICIREKTLQQTCML